MDFPQEGSVDSALWLRISSLSSSAASVVDFLPELQTTQQADACAVFTYDAETTALALAGAHPAVGSPEPVMTDVRQLTQVRSVDSGASADPALKPIVIALGITFESALSAPLACCGEFGGVIVWLYRAPRTIAPRQQVFAQYIGYQVGFRAAVDKLKGQIQKLQDDLESRKLVERAKGILMRNHNLTEEEAYLRLRAESRRMRKQMKELAQAIILSEQIRSQSS